MPKIIIVVNIKIENIPITAEILTNIEAAVEDTLTEYDIRHDLASAKLE